MPSGRVVEAVADALSASGRYNRDDKVQPIAVLWPDPARTWEPVMDLMREVTPVLTLGPYDVANQTGPAIWIRCRLSERLATSETGPIVTYLPGVERSDLRAVETSPSHLQPLGELQFRSTWWLRGNQAPWTPAGFLRSSDGLDLDLARDDDTTAALGLALREVVASPVDVLRARGRIDAGYLSSLLVSDVTRTLLEWLDSPDEARASHSSNEWAAFLGQCRAEFGVDVEAAGPLTVAQKFAQQQGSWKKAWDRFADAPHLYPNIAQRLRQAKPPSEHLFEDVTGPWPQDNDDAEQSLAQALKALKTGSASDARESIAILEGEHAPRRASVWVKLGMSPLAEALAPLSEVARTTAEIPDLDSVEAFKTWYVEEGHKVDHGAVTSLAKVVEPALREVVGAALRATYLPWLDDVARSFQRVVGADVVGDTGLSLEDGDCVVFVDGLRLDVGQTLRSKLAANGMTVSLTPRVAAIPTMTASGKPAVAPLTAPMQAGGELAPTTGGAEVNAAVLRTMLRAESVQPLGPDETGDPAGRGWTETGDLDGTGHKLGIKLVDRIPQEVADIASRVQLLLGAGWTRVHVVTDHGWLLMPGALLKVELPQHLADPRKPRCARLNDGAGAVDQPTFPWTWDRDVRIAVPRGIAAFEAGRIYEHGGVSPQESITPHLIVTAGVAVSQTRIEGVRWRGLRCRVDFAQVPDGSSLDVRRTPGNAASSFVGPKAVVGSDEASVLVEDDSLLGDSAYVVILSASGEILAQLPTRVGD